MYKYETEKPFVFSEDGQVAFLQIRDKVQVLLKAGGAFAMGKVANSWEQMACVDRLVELGEIRTINRGEQCQGQYRLFTKPGE